MDDVETRVKAAQYPLDLDISWVTPCNSSFNEPGVMCDTDCMNSFGWCNHLATTCYTGSGDILTNNPMLCQDPRVWANVSCHDYFDDGRVMRFGLRCTGQNMRCVRPWYNIFDGEPLSFWDTQCPDKSDQVFNISLTCRQHLQQHMDFHTQNFCNEDYSYLQSGPICTNKTEWLSGKDKSYTDPHSCQSSCSVPGPDCLACTNTSYFICTKSDQCLHPDLLCDGHPQCPGGEDEDLDMCYPRYVELGIIQPYARSRCRSPLYHNMEILSIPCDGVKECYDGSDEDESFCSNPLKVHMTML